MFDLEDIDELTELREYENRESRVIVETPTGIIDSGKFLVVQLPESVVEKIRIITCNLSSKEVHNTLDIIDITYFDKSETYIEQIKKLQKEITLLENRIEQLEAELSDTECYF